MISFIKYLEDNTALQLDDTPITRIYDKAKISVGLVRKYNPDILSGISVIANLGSGAYGVYTHYSSEDKRSIYFGKNIPNNLIKKMYPDVPDDDLKKGDVIRVNVNRILNDPKVNSDLDAVMQIAATIVHEATHAQEVAKTGVTNETMPEKNERAFIALMQKPDINKEIIVALLRFPQSSRKVKNKLY